MSGENLVPRANFTYTQGVIVTTTPTPLLPKNFVIKYIPTQIKISSSKLKNSNSNKLPAQKTLFLFFTMPFPAAYHLQYIFTNVITHTRSKDN